MNRKMSTFKYLLVIIIFFVLTVLGILSLYSISKYSINANTNLNNSVRNTQIKNKFLKGVVDAEVNSIFINKLPNEKSIIYVGGRNLKDSTGKFGGLVESSNNGKTWETISYFQNSSEQNGVGNSQPIVRKILTDWYTDKNGTSDSIVVTGFYLKSSTSNTSSDSYSGQISYKQIYYAKTGTNTNISNSSEWKDVAFMDNMHSTSETVIDASTIKYSSQIIINNITTNVEQNHIYFVTNHVMVQVNNITVIPYIDPSTKAINPNWKPKFSLYDLFINNSTDNSVTEVSKTELFLNPLSIYAPVDTSSGTPTITNVSWFDAINSNFIFESGLVIGNGDENLKNECFIVENQHFYDQNTSSESYKSNKINSYDLPNIIEFKINDGSSAPKFLVPDSNVSIDNSDEFNNFRVNTIATNSVELNTEDGGLTSLVFGGEQNNLAKIIIPSLLSTSAAPINPPKFPISGVVNNNLSYVSKIISIYTKESQTSTYNEPFVISGKNLSSDLSIDYLGNKFIPNTQNLKDKGLLLANIKIYSNLDNTEYNYEVNYSEDKLFASKNIINIINNGYDYSCLGVSELGEDSKTFSVYSNISTSINTLHVNDINNIKVNKLPSGSFVFKNIPWQVKKKMNLIIHVVVPVVVVIILFIVLFVFMTKDIFINKNKKNRNISKKIKNKKTFKSIK